MTFSYFNSRPLYRGRHPDYGYDIFLDLFQLTPPIQRATINHTTGEQREYISTHAPYTEGDTTLRLSTNISPYFNSRPLYRGRLIRQLDYMITLIFQLTPPIQRATIVPPDLKNSPYISTHAPYTEGDFFFLYSHYITYISTHAPYTEGD